MNQFQSCQSLRAPAKASAYRQRLTLAIIAFIALALIFIPSTETSAHHRVVTVSNLSEVGGPELGLSDSVARFTSFTTGNVRYRLNNVRIAAGSSSTFLTVVIRRDANGKPGALYQSLTTSDSVPTTGRRTLNYSPQRTVYLEPFATYWIGINPSGDNGRILLADSDNQSSSYHWTIGNDTRDASGNRAHHDPFWMEIEATEDPQYNLAASNFGQDPSSLSLPEGSTRATSFATGNSPYVLTRIRLLLKRDSNSVRYTVRILANGGGNIPGNILVTLTGRSTISTSVESQADFTSSGFYLAPNTTYWVMMTTSDGDGDAAVATSDNQDPAIASGWNIGNNTLRPDGSGWTQQSAHSIKMQVFAVQPKRLTSVTVSSKPLDGDTYKAGENLELEYRFSSPVNWQAGGAKLRIGSSDRTADYIGGNGTNTLLYRYRVQSSDMDTSNGFNIPADSLGGHNNIATVADNHPVKITQASQDAGNSHKVNGGSAGCNRLHCADLEIAQLDGHGVDGAQILGFSHGDAGTLSNRVVTHQGSSYLVEELLARNGNLELAFDRPIETSLIRNTRVAVGDLDLRLSEGTVTGNRVTWRDVSPGWTSGSTVRVSLDLNPAEVNFRQSSYTVTEGGTVTVEVEIGRRLGFPISVPITATSGGYATSSDYSGVPTSLAFAAGTTQQQMFFQATDDTVNDDAERVILGFGEDLPYQLQPGSTPNATVAITDNDDPAQPNVAATGVPTITGTAEVGHTLTAAKGTIADSDGIATNAAYRYQWVRVISGTDTDIQGATGSTYVLQTADAANKVKVKVSFRDNAGNYETRPSPAFPATGTVADAYVPRLLSTTASGTKLKLAYDSKMRTSPLPAAGAFAVRVAGNARTLANSSPVAVSSRTVTLTLSSAVTPGQAVTVAYTKPGTNPLTTITNGSAASFTARAVANITPGNATGKPVVSGYTVSGHNPPQKLVTAFVGNTADPQGVHTPPPPDPSTELWCDPESDAGCAYQWVRVDGPDEYDIASATGRDYPLAAEDVGKKLKVRISFKDKGNNLETVTSDAFPDGSSVILSHLPRLPVQVTAVEIAGPGPDNVWTHGENFDIAVTLSAPVRTAGGSYLLCWTGDERFPIVADLHSGHGSNQLTFRCTAEGEAATQVGVARNSLIVQGSLLHLTYDYMVVSQSNPGQTLASPVHQVAGPAITGIEINSPGPNGLWERGERVEVTVTFDAPVAVNEGPGKPYIRVRQIFDPDSGYSPLNLDLPYDRTQGSSTVVFARTLDTQGSSRRVAFEVAANSIQANKGVIADAATGALADLSHQGLDGATALMPPCNSSYPREIWCGVLTVGTLATRSGYSQQSSVGGLSDTQFQHGGGSYQILGIDHDPGTGLRWDLGTGNTSFDHDELRLHIGTMEYPFSEATLGSTGYQWTRSTIAPGWTAGDRATARLVRIKKPTVQSIWVTGTGHGSTWRVERPDTVHVWVTFDEPVRVTNGEDASVNIFLSEAASRATRRTAKYHSGSGTKTLGFRYTLAEGRDSSTSVVRVEANSLSPGGGTIRSVATQADASATHGGIAIRGSQTRGVGPSVRFTNTPASHDGTTPFKLVLQFSGAPDGLQAKRHGKSVLQVQGGTAGQSRQTSAGARPEWEIAITPAGPDDVVINVPVRTCEQPDAVCMGGEPLGDDAHTVVPGLSITANTRNVPTSHDGATAFTFELHLSYHTELGYVTVRDALFDITGGSITKARRLTKGNNQQWEVTVTPAGNADMVMDARATTDCSAQHAICTADGRKFDGNLTLTVPGPPQEAPEITSGSIFSVPEGATAIATLTATDGDTNAADLTWSIVGGDDSNHFSVTDAGALSFSGVKDFESPDDSDGDRAYQVTVQVSDGGRADSAGLTVTLSNVNEAPTANAGVDQTEIAQGSTVTLHGSGTDPDTGEVLAFMWAQAGTPSVTLSDAATASPTFSAPTGLTEATTLTFTLRVSDDEGLYAEDSVSITVLAAPREEEQQQDNSQQEEGALPPLTATASVAPASHDGSNTFTFELRLSEEPRDGFSYTIMRDHAFTVTGGRVVKAKRLAPPSNIGWLVHITPDGNGEVTVVLPVTADCDAQGAICTSDLRMLSNRVEVTVPGPGG